MLRRTTTSSIEDWSSSDLGVAILYERTFTSPGNIPHLEVLEWDFRNLTPAVSNLRARYRRWIHEANQRT